MTESKRKAFVASASSEILSKAIQVVIVIYMIVVLGALLVQTLTAGQWLNAPFIGGFVEPTMVFNGNDSIEQPSSWPTANENMMAGDQLLDVDGVEVLNSRALLAVLRQKSIGESTVLQVKRPDGEMQELTIALIGLPDSDRLTYFYLPYVIGWIYFLTGLWIFIAQRHQASSRTFAIFSASVALASGCLFDLYTSHIIANLWVFGLPLAAASLINLALLFPKTDPVLVRHRYLEAIPYALAFILGGFALLSLGDQAHPTRYMQAFSAVNVFTAAAMLFSALWFLLRRLPNAAAMEREQVRLLILGGVVAFAPIAVRLVGSLFWFDDVSFSPFFLLPLLVFPLVAAYVVQRYSMISVSYFLSRVFLYGLMGVLVSVGYALLLAGLGVAMVGIFPRQSPILAGLLFFLAAMAINPFRQRMESLMDAVFFRGEKAYQERMQTFNGELTGVAEIEEIIKLLRQYVQRSLLPDSFHIFIFDPLVEQYAATRDVQKTVTSDLRFPENSALVQTLEKRKTCILLEQGNQLPDELKPDDARLRLLGATVFVPVLGNQHLAGWLALGERASGEAYALRDLKFLESISSQAALAIERAQVVANMESRVREMNVLARVAQGINITLSLDDILELIYAQTTQVIPADDFQILTLSDGNINSGLIAPIFFVEENDRLTARENQVLVGGGTLDQEVIIHQRSILTDDYAQECRYRNVPVVKEGVYAWMGVPLNAGAETIGALSLGMRQATVSYTSEQLNLLQAIADQAAGAIVKARLLEESNRRARQLTTLNEMSRQLTSTLEIEPLLQNILQSAVDILNCEAGSLLLLDEATNELVFRVTVGPVAVNLADKRLPAGSGLVGKAVETKAPVIVNDVQQSAEWFAKTDEQTGFITRALLVVPLQLKDAVLGVFEVINKKDGSPFRSDEQELLTAFASQAAVALENARLYTMTDQALAERVEELSVMQRIDRELNTSLDTSRAMRITLEWAMRRSGAKAGLIGLVHEAGVEVVSHMGYEDEIAAYEETLIPLEEYHLEYALEATEPKQFYLGANEEGLLSGARNQVIIPIRREDSTLGVLMLESAANHAYSAELVEFLSRLIDHAAIAISNASLYAEVQQANVAKSEFVSFVSHELKNPMTSIKGYSELLSAGAVGPINEAQSNFLETIHNNVERMRTLVSDLADVSRIEAGRLRLDFLAVDLKEMSEEVARSLRRLIESKQQNLELAIPEDLPALWGDRTRIVQVLTNLVSNSCKYTQEEGHVIVSAEAVDNQWDPDGAPKVIHIWVKDDGIGISEEDQKNIFQKFFRSEDPKTREAPGTGLGLNITRSLVEALGGKIWFESKFREGTTFHFTVPVSE
ncbi:MAG: GAF domain-containing protein [Anaerolineaceae bacterium]|nr:GAF domain-containing protein [Anaerolineaceae bacterium]